MRGPLPLVLLTAALVARAGPAPAPAAGGGANAELPGLDLAPELPGLDLAPAVLDGRFTDQGAGEELCFEPADPAEATQGAAPAEAARGPDRLGFCFDDPVRARALLGLPAELPAGACRLTGRARVEVTGLSAPGAASAAAAEVEARPSLVRALGSAVDPAPPEPPRALALADGARVAVDVPLSAAGLTVAPGELARTAAHRLSRGLVDPERGAFLFDLAAGPGARLVRLDLAGAAWPAPLPLPDPRPGERILPAALGWVDGAPATLLLRVARGEPPRGTVVALGGAGAPRVARTLEALAPALRALLLGDGAVLAQAGSGEAAGWWIYPAAGGARRLELPPGPVPAAVVGKVALLALPAGLTAVDGAGAARPVRGCSPCADPDEGALVGGPGDRFGCLRRDPAPLPGGQEGFGRRLFLCRLGPDGEAASLGDRPLEPALRYGDACHLRWPVQGPGTVDPAGRYLELELGVGEAPRLRVVVYAPPGAP